MPCIEPRRVMRLSLFVGVWLISAAAVGAAPRPVVLSGEVYQIGTQAILTPPSDSSPVVLRSYVAEGMRVKAGDVVLSIDGGQADANIRTYDSQRAQARAGADKEIAELQVKAIDAERLLRGAEAAVAKAEVDAAIPAAHLAALDYDRYQGELERSRRELAVAKVQFAAASEAVTRREADAKLQLDQLIETRDFWQSQVDAAVVYAKSDGVVVHGFDPWRGGRYDEGSSSYPGQRVGDLIPDGADARVGVRAFALEVDRQFLQEGDSVELSFDALRGKPLLAHIGHIAGAPQAKAEWGEGRYYEIEIALPEDFALPLLPGSSVRIAIQPAQTTGASVAAATVGRMDGEVVALDASAISPPAIEDLWMLTLTQLVPDGTPVEAGQLVAAFDGNELMRKLSEKQGTLNEKNTQLERLSLELAERERSERIATAEQRAKLEKAQRKAAQPESLYAQMEYRKLVVDRKLAEAEMQIVSRREVLAARQRQAEREQLQAEVDLLKHEVSALQVGLAALNVKAPRAGVMLHLSNWQGEKYDVGAQIFRGQPLAQIPDLEQLAVRMQVPERQLGAVTLGQRVVVNVEGGAVPTLTGKVKAIGRVVRSRSRVNPVPVVDVDIQLDTLPAGTKLKPGQPVRVDLHTEPAA